MICILIGISGASGSGKTSYSQSLAKRLKSPLKPISLDNFCCQSPPQTYHPKLGKLWNYETPESLKSEELYKLLSSIKQCQTMEKLMNYAKNNRYLAAQNSDNNDTNFIYIVVEGFLLFALTDPLTHLFDIRLFLDAEKETCCRRRYVRESKNHLDVNGEEINESFKLWFDDLVWKHYLEHKDRQKQAAHQSIHERDYTNSNYAQIDAIVDDKIAKIIYENINK